MSFTPQGALCLISNVPLDNSYEHTLDFDTIYDQYDYFHGKLWSEFTEYTYMKKENSIKVNMNIGRLQDINYLMFNNYSPPDDYSPPKWIYSFILDKKYINDNVTELVIETDVFQTYLFDYEFGDTYIDREHQDRWVNRATPIYSITPENLTLGEEYVKVREDVIADSSKYFLVIASECIDDTPIAPTMIQNYPTPFFYYLVPYSPVDGIMDAQWLCTLLTTNPKVIGVSWVPFLPFPMELTTHVTYSWNDGLSHIGVYRISSNMATKKIIGDCAKFTDADLPVNFGTGHARSTVKESKLLTYPYAYNLLTDMQSQPLILKNEYLESATLIEITVTQGLSFNMKTKYFVSSGYLGEYDGKMNALINNTVNDLPLKTYEYYNYMLSHKAQSTTGMALAGVEAVGAIGVGVATGGLGLALGAGTLMRAGSSIAGELAKQKDLKNTPETVRHMGNNLTFDMADGNTSVKLFRYSVTAAIKKILADYFAMYGYKAMQLKVPNLRSRYYYNYIKTIGCNLDGDFDTKDITKLKTIFDNGVTIWHMRNATFHAGATITPLNYQYDNVEMNLI